MSAREVPSTLDQEGGPINDDYESSKRSKFRFKSKRKRHDDHYEYDNLAARSPRRSKSHRSSNSDTSDRLKPHDGHRHRHHHHRHHHRSKRRDRPPPTPPDDPTLYDDTFMPNTRSENYLSPDAAFRESLFDALADDEGADFWQSVYGQPIHTYSAMREGPGGELEQMTEEEYSAHVRAKMWEKTHQHLIEEQKRRTEERTRREKVRKESERMGRDREVFEREIQRSLRTGEERKRKARWRKRWGEYLRGWDELKELCTTGEKKTVARGKIWDKIPWPTESGKMADLKRDQIESFFHNAQGTGDEELDLLLLLKVERVRWHPDKVQQRFGSEPLDPAVVKAVTAVFQIVDTMWAQERNSRE
ncbi:MAG: hypothetical protein M1837_006219 [Sclerophora amabilis]|nr:MAG: hypothetical protein M1837_006219 [Sclerophora amabilis]